MKEGNSACISLVAEGTALDTCGVPTCITAHHGIAVWVPHRCTRASCPVCSDGGYVVDEASRILKTIQRRVLGRCEVDHGLHRGRTLKVYTFIYSPRENYAPDTEEAFKKDKARMYKRLAEHGLAYGWAVFHPYRGEHGPEDSGPVIRASMDRTVCSGHWHGIALSHWSSPALPDQGYYLGVDCIGQLDDGIILPLLWGRIGKKLRYMLNHAACTSQRQIVCRWGRWPYDGAPRPDARPMWKHPDTGQKYYLTRNLFSTRVERDADGHWKDEAAKWDDNTCHMDAIKDEFARRLLWQSPLADPIEILGGDTYRPMSYQSVKCEPDDSDGEQWDTHLMSLLPIRRKRIDDEK